MRARMDSLIEQVASATVTGLGIHYVVQTVAGEIYVFSINLFIDVGYHKSTDGGLTFGPWVSVFAGTATALSVWYDRWSGIAAGLIHVAWQESATDDTLYRTVDTESSDALSTQTSIFAGTDTATGGCLSICRARGGNVYCATMIDAGSEGGFFRLPNANVPNGAWDAARTTVFEAATEDQIILMPGWAADNQDMMAFFWDASADEVSRKIYDDSANTWAETSIATGMVDVATITNFSAAVDTTNSRNLLVAWEAFDLLNADLRCWHVTESAITEVTNVVTNSVDDQGFCAITIDTLTGYWWVFYGGKSDGSETFNDTMNIYCKASTDSGTTWGPETALTNVTRTLVALWSIPRMLAAIELPPPVGYYSTEVVAGAQRLNVGRRTPRANLLLR